jgi:trans-2,3-dihydro-3-hydroxyanthranilate isomerase
MHEYTVVDAFARRPLEGNPVAVFLDAADLTAELMQRIARELNLSETTFVLPPERGGDARVRIFTPVNELPFAGHPMLGTALALSEPQTRDVLRLETAMGVIPFELGDDDGVATVRMRQPVPTWEPYEHAEELLATLGVGASTAPVEVYCNGPRHVFVGLASVAALSALHPDHRALSRFPDMAANCFAGDGTRWRARMFSPAYGVVEDAATGSAAGPLAIHLARHGLAEYGQVHEILQGVEIGRPSLMRASAHGAGEEVREVYVAGHAVVVAHGVLHLEDAHHSGRSRVSGISRAAG